MKLAAGANASNKGSGYFGVFSNPAIFGTRYFSTLSFAKETKTYELIEQDERISDSFLEKGLSGNLGFGHRFQWFNVSTNISRMVRSYDYLKNYAAPDAYANNRLGLTVEFDQRDYKLYFSDGFFAQIRHQKTFLESDKAKNTTQTEAAMSWQHDVYGDHALLIQMNGMKISGGRFTDTDRVGSTKGFRGIETKTAWAESYLVETLEYQVPIQNLDSGTLAWALFADHGRIENRGGNASLVDYTAAGLGLYFYLKKLAIPGVGLEWGVNTEYQKNFVNFSVGMSY